MKVRSAFAIGTTVPDVTATLVKNLRSESAGKLLLYFASPRLSPAELAPAMQAAFPGVPTVGCTTAGELAAGRMLKGCITAMLLDESLLESVIIEDVSDIHDEAAVRAALAGLSRSVGSPLSSLDPTKYVGLVLIDGMSVGEEKLMGILSSATNVPFVGGSAGDELAFKKTHVFVHGAAKSGGAVLVLLRPKVRFDILKTQSFVPTDKTLRVTEADPKNRTVHRFNDRPATEAYAAALGIPPEDLPSRFMSNPVGLMVGDKEPFVRSPQQVQGTSVVFYCEMHEGSELTILESGDIVAETERALAEKKKTLGDFSAVLNFHCILRTLELEQKKQEAAYGALFDSPTVGFSTYGEEYIGHMNQTSTMVLFGTT